MDKVTIFHEKCHSLYIKELLKLLLPGLDIVIISLDNLVFLISPDFYQDEPDVFHQRNMTSLPLLNTRDHPRFFLSGSCCSIFFILCRVLWITVCLIFYYSIVRPSSINGFRLPFINIVNPHLLNETVFVLTISADIRNARH